MEKFLTKKVGEIKNMFIEKCQKVTKIKKKSHYLDLLIYFQGIFFYIVINFILFF